VSLFSSFDRCLTLTKCAGSATAATKQQANALTTSDSSTSTSFSSRITSPPSVTPSVSAVKTPDAATASKNLAVPSNKLGLGWIMAAAGAVLVAVSL
jgi:hypothetical protein